METTCKRQTRNSNNNKNKKEQYLIIFWQCYQERRLFHENRNAFHVDDVADFQLCNLNAHGGR